MNTGKLVTMHFTTTFSCTGSACPNNCCHDWKIGVEQRIYEELQQLYGATPEDKAFFANSLKRNEDAGSEQDYAILQNDAQGNCRFLDGQGWCRIHKEHGAEHLGHTCKDYPRIINDNFGQLELMLSLSCPEAARLFIEGEDSTELCEAPSTLLEQTSGYCQMLPDGESLPPYYQYRNEIRQILMVLAEAEQFPVAGRIFLMLHFANQIAPLFHAGSDESTLEALVEQIDAIANPDNHPRLIQQFIAVPEDQARAIGTLLAIILFRTEVSKSTFSDYAAATLQHYGLDIHNLDEASLGQAFPPLIVRYLENRNTLQASHGAFLERQLGKLLRYNGFKQQYILVDSLLAHVRGLLLGVQLVKFLFLLHPKVDALCHALREGSATDADEQRLREAMIETLYQTSRAFDHWGNSGGKLLSESLDAQGINTFEQLVQFSKA